MYDTLRMEIRETLEHLQRVYLQNALVLYTSMLEEGGEAATLTVFLEDVYLIAMDLDAVVFHDVRVVEHLHDLELVADVRVQVREAGCLLELDLLDGHERVRVEVDCEVDGPERACADESPLLPPNGHVRA